MLTPPGALLVVAALFLISYLGSFTAIFMDMMDIKPILIILSSFKLV